MIDLRKVDVLKTHIMRERMQLSDFASVMDVDVPDHISRNILKVGRNYFLSDERSATLKDSIKRDIFSLGLFLGEEKGHFMPSPAFIDMLSRFPGSQRKIFINKKAEWLFLCGRNILMDSIVKNPSNITDGYVFVQNERDENLGYGMFKKEDTLIIKNLLDKGAYLRVEDRKRR